MTCYGCPGGCSRCNNEPWPHPILEKSPEKPVKKPERAATPRKRSTPSGGGNPPEHFAQTALEGLLDYVSWAVATGPEFLPPQLHGHATAWIAAAAACQGPRVQVVSGRTRDVVAEEREACAKEAEAMCYTKPYGKRACDCDAHKLARSIRARGTK